MRESRSWIVGEGDAGDRLDLVLSSIADISRSQARRWIDAGLVCVNGGVFRPSHRVQTGDLLEATPPEPLPSPLQPEPIPLSILHEDDDVIVVDKPAGLVVHPAPGHACGTLVNALLYHCGPLAGVGGVLRPGIVHRLDKGTSGVLVAAKNDVAHRNLAVQFHDHTIEREYRALVRGLPGAEVGDIDRPVGRHRRDRKRMSVHAGVAREARTRWRVLQRFPASERSWLEIRPETGRTHQIRVHLASIGLPIVGDPVYGRARSGGAAPGRPALHAARLGFAHPRTSQRMRFEAPLPEDLGALLADLERREASR